ncbi:hypothetical protein RB595_001493 [Gaeumannomyces hyphopodioides]
MRFSTLFHIGAIAALGAPVLAQQPATDDLAALGARGLEEPMILEARRDPGQNSVPKLPKKKAPATNTPATTRTNLPPARGAGRAAALRNTYPGFGQQKRSVLEARRDPGQNSLPKRPKKKAPATNTPGTTDTQATTNTQANTQTNPPPARGAGRAAALRNIYPGFGQQQKRSVLEARRDPGQNSVPKLPKKKAPTTNTPATTRNNLPPARGAGRAAALRNTYPGFGQ